MTDSSDFLMVKWYDLAIFSIAVFAVILRWDKQNKK